MKLNSSGIILKNLLPLAVFIIGVIVLRQTGYLHNIIEDINEHQNFAPFIYITLFAVASNLFIPTSLLIMSGAVLFGGVYGFAYAFSGGISSVLLGFLLFKHLNFMKSKCLRENLAPLFQKVHSKGSLAVLFIRLMAIPFTLQNILTSILKIPFTSYLIYSVIGMTPWFIGFSFFGESLLKMKYHLLALSALLLLVLFVLAGNILRSER